ncbi:MAG: hydrogenase small subunit [Actinomycetes bacterium]|jgi:hydrogenase small subunit|nr:hydrogenase small subunit [Actinomycetes bacterium]
MTQEAVKEASFYERLSHRGVSRRDFLKFCGSTAAVLGMSSAMVPTIATKIAGAAESGLTPALWIHGGACTGCSESIAQATYPNVADIVLDILSLQAQETVQMATGEYVEQAQEACYEANKGAYIMIFEGAVMTGLDGNTLRVAGQPLTEHLKKICAGAAAVVAVGSCAVDGGWTRAYPNPAGGMGIGEWMAQEGIGTPCVNLPGCPVNPEEIVAVVVQALICGDLTQVVASLDEFGRPKYLYGSTIHDNCPRRGHFENGEFVYTFGSPEEGKAWCLYPLGCKGPQTYRRCPMIRWNNSVSWCVDSGGPCIGCANWNWVDNNAPFRGRVRQVGKGVIGGPGGVSPVTAASVVGGVVAVALVAHGFGMKAAGRIGKNPTMKTETMKEYDRKRLKKEAK